MFVNFTNHPSSLWSEPQLKAAYLYGEIQDIPFPNVPPDATEREVDMIAEEYTEKITAMQPSAILCQGEMTLAFSMVHRLLSLGYTVLCACSERQVIEQQNADGSTQRVSRFNFCRFRKYMEN